MALFFFTSGTQILSFRNTEKYRSGRTTGGGSVDLAGTVHIQSERKTAGETLYFALINNRKHYPHS